ncbi:unnamed protein product [Calicophoron daubneyi]|uniref:Uncharacterized protein n=1 Tax=Calicophoron daubneyi TaxID=300641 RepID=A0AAV2U0C9_CALDB
MFKITSIFCWSLVCDLVFSLTLTSIAEKKEFKLRSMSSVPKYRLVSYLARHSGTEDVKVKKLSIPEQSFYTHVHFAWECANKALSHVALKSDSGVLDIAGANMALPITCLPEMYAPGNISAVIDFAINCYSWASPKQSQSFQPVSYVSALRAAESIEINKNLIHESTSQFLMSTQTGAYHFVWEDYLEMNEFMHSLNYTTVVCGNSPSVYNPCDWKLVGLNPNEASNLCLYRIINEELKPTNSSESPWRLV